MIPFWAITRHADVEAISRDPKRWLIAPRLAVFPEEQYETANPPFHHLLHMDPPEHGKYRSLMALRFTPRILESKREAIGRIVDDVLARIAGKPEVDFVESVSAIVPLAVIAEMIGLPREDWGLMFDLSNAIIAGADPDFQQGASTRETTERAAQQAFDYFRRLTDARRREPRED